MDNYEEEEINLKDCFFYVLRHLKLMLIVGIVVGLLLGGYKGYKGYKEAVNSNLDYSDDVAEYASNKESFSEELTNRETSLINYINNSAFLSLDPYSSYQVKASYYVSTDYKIIASNSYQDIDYTSTVLSSYVSLLTSDDILEEIASKSNVEVSYLREFVDVSSSDYILNISVYSNDKDEALDILSSFEDVLPSITTKINDSVVSNTISLVSKTTYEGKNSDILTKQQSMINDVSSLLSQLSSVQTSVNNLSVSSYAGNPNKAFMSNFIKWALIGLLVGMILVAGVYFLVFIFSNKVYSADEFKDKTNIRVLGQIAKDKNTFIDNLEHRPTTTDIDLLTSNLNTFSSNKTILFTGELLDEELVSKLDKDIISAGSIINDSKALESLNKTTDIVLVVKCNKTDYKSIKEVRERIKDLNKTIVGCVVVE